LGDRILALDDVSGFTATGGEPGAQALYIGYPVGKSEGCVFSNEPPSQTSLASSIRILESGFVVDPAGIAIPVPAFSALAEQPRRTVAAATKELPHPGSSVSRPAGLIGAWEAGTYARRIGWDD
jgi:hypothetical protein